MRLDPFPETFFTQAGCIQSANCSSLNGVIWDEYRKILAWVGGPNPTESWYEPGLQTSQAD